MPEGKDYPSEEDLEKIRTWQINGSRESFLEFFMFIEDVYNHVMGYVHTVNVDNAVTLATGGWSGNEDIIEAIQSNFIVWSMCWSASYRGGKHEFVLPDVKAMTI